MTKITVNLLKKSFKIVYVCMSHLLFMYELLTNLFYV